MRDEITNKSVDEWIHEAFLFSQDEKFENALDCYRNAITIDSENTRAWYNMGVIYNQISQYRAALMCLDEVIRLNPFFKDVKRVRQDIIASHPVVLIKKADPDTQHLLDSLKKQGKLSLVSQFRSQLMELKGGTIFSILGFLSLIAALATLIELLVVLGNGLGFSWILLITTVISFLSAAAWFTIPQKFEQIANLFKKVINMQQKMIDKEPE